MKRINNQSGLKNNLFLVLNKILSQRSLTLLIVVIFLIIIMSSIFKDRFFSFSNAAAVLLSLSSIGIISFGMVFLLVSGVFDLSVGSIFALGMVTVAYFLKELNLPVPVAIILSIMVCMLAGLFNGFVISKMKINPLVTTLATLGIFRGVAILIGKQGITGLPKSFTFLGQKVIFGLQFPIYLLILIFIILAVLLNRTLFFRQYFFIGGNPQAAILSGISLDTVRMSGYVLSASLAGIAGIIQAARLGSGIVSGGAGLELQAIAACVIGGASLYGGKGSISGAFMGALFMALVFNIMIIARIDVYWQSIINGLILIIAVYTDVLSTRFVKQY